MGQELKISEQKKLHAQRAREMPHLLRALAALAEDLSSVSSTRTHIAHTPSQKLTRTVRGKKTACAESPREVIVP